ncbi:MAG: carbamoyltransferase [Planctomycetota bacterium]|nr:carbamoyltransferase [Planctomycetota bacterium]
MIRRSTGARAGRDVRVVLGVHAGHDAGAAVVRDGELVAAVNEERLARKKLFWGWPARAVPEVLRLAGVSPRDVDRIAVAGTSGSAKEFGEKGYRDLGFAREFVSKLSKGPVAGVLLGQQTGVSVLRTVMKLRHAVTKRAMKKRLLVAGIAAPVSFVDHHRCHNASAYHTSGWDDCLAVSLDGSGDGYCSRVYLCRGGRMELVNSIPSYHSPGYYYNYVTHLLGFTPLRHEGKITGLAAYGDPSVCGDVFRRRLRYDREKTSFHNRGRWMTAECAYLERALDGCSREDIAAAVQRNTEDVVAAYVRDLVGQSGASHVVLSGGVFANVRVNQVLWSRSEADEIYVHPHMGDGGLAAGAALDQYHELNLAAGHAYEPTRLDHVYLGPEYSEYEIERALTGFPDLDIARPDALAEAVADELAAGKVVARFGGGMEYGPRALGNRSVLCEAKDPDINNWLNQRLNRTEFMPFAPVTIDGRAEEYFARFDSERSRATRFMTCTYDVTDRCAREAPATVHVDGTARPQVVRREDNPVYHDIIEAYGRRTGTPVLVNTSFNMHEEPIVNDPEVAIRSFLRGGLDVLALGPFVVKQQT